ncbi:hypothetical protein [Bizionia arctica]|uniref:Uncharacterized protein n=1 Tax=Bizionia arctica TaxID=1495645 RepID=A0A917LJP9_9FLAO|nr:hypothetical protein [Bizionia arctica]GGG32704.1 hypothetical protein GCM10010976_00610 [Bizionia arctica]
MAPIKFEENIKEKLEKRTLQPSSQAWDRLSKKLDTAPKKSSIKTIWWFGIAASLVGILFMINMFLNTPETNNFTPVLVDTEINEVDIFKNNEKVDIQETLVVKEGLNATINNLSEEKINSDGTGKKLKNYPVKNTQVVHAETNREAEEMVNNLSMESPKDRTALVTLETQEKTNKTVTDIDALLLKAQQNISKTANSNTYAIDAKALLQDVEEDLEESFRDKVFETIKTNYKKVKTAVAERND